MNRWERRTPLTPTHVRKLVREGYNVIVQPSKMRIFTDDQYVKAGSSCIEIFGISFYLIYYPCRVSVFLFM